MHQLKKRDWDSELKYTILLYTVYKADIHSMESYSTREKERASEIANSRRTLIAEWKMSLSTGYIRYDPIYITFPKWQNNSDRWQITCCQEESVMVGDGGAGETTKRTKRSFVIIKLLAVVVVRICTRDSVTQNRRTNANCLIFESVHCSELSQEVTFQVAFEENGSKLPCISLNCLYSCLYFYNSFKSFLKAKQKESMNNHFWRLKGSTAFSS